MWFEILKMARVHISPVKWSKERLANLDGEEGGIQPRSGRQTLMGSNPCTATSLAEHTPPSSCPLSERQELRKTVMKTGQIAQLSIIANAEALFYSLALNKLL